ncbi:hypothetical protein D9M68_999020 [compost metagenome]
MQAQFACDRHESVGGPTLSVHWFLHMTHKKAADPERSVIAQFEAEARRLAGQVSENQRRFLKVGLSKGKALEPLGRLAGPDNT